MVSSGQHIQMKVFQTLDNIAGDILNVFWFEVSAISTPTPLSAMNAALKTWFQGDFSPPIRNIQAPGLVYRRVEFNCVENYETDFTIVVLDDNIGGNVSSPYLASSTAWSFQLVRTFRTTRHGSKRFAGVPELLVEENLATPATAELLEEVEVVLSSPPQVLFPVDGTMDLLSVIPKTPVAPATLPSVFNGVSGALYRGVGTQNTRKQLSS